MRLSTSRARLGTVASTASPGWGADALRGGRLGRARLPVDARRYMKIKTNADIKNVSTCQVKRRRGMFQA